MSQEDEQAPIQIVSARYRTTTSPLRRLPLVSSRPDELPSRLGAEVVRAVLARAEEVLEPFKLMDSSVEDDYSEPDYEFDWGDDFQGAYKVDISMQETENCPETAAPTIMIQFKSFPTNREALQKTMKQIAEFARDISNGPICVEMIDRKLVYGISYGPVRDRPDLLQCWDKMRVLVYECLEAHEATKGSMTSISLFRYGTRQYYGNNPVTIFITVDFNSQEVGWPDVIDDIEKSLKEHQLPSLYIHIENNIGLSSAPPSLLDLEDESTRNRIGRGSIEDDYNKTVNLGEVIGPANFVVREDWSQGYPGHGNLGCYVEVKTAQGNWEKYGLTNYNVVRGAFPGFNTAVDNKQTVLVKPSPQSALLVADANGLLPASHQALYSMESPPRSMHDYTLWAAQKHLDHLNDSLQRLQVNPSYHPDGDDTYRRVEGYKVELVEAVEKKQDFFYFYQHFMGEIFAASGFNERTTENGRLDWALIKVDERRSGTNILPDKSAWEQVPGYRGDTPFLTFGQQLHQYSEGISVDNPVQCEEAFKYGTTTGPVRGKLHMTRTDIQFKDDQHIGDDPVSSEYLFQMERQSRDEPFAGSIVYNGWGRILGLLSRGLQPQRAGDVHVHVTPIEDVFRHIKESSDGKIIDIRVAQPQSA